MKKFVSKIKSIFRNLLSGDIFANIFFNRLFNHFIIGKRVLESKGLTSSDFLKDSYIFLKKQKKHNFEVEPFLKSLKIKLDEVDYLYPKAKSVGKYTKMSWTDESYKNLEVKIDKSQGILSIVNLEKEQYYLSAIEGLINNSSQFKEIHDVYGKPKIELIKLERKRRSIETKNKKGVIYNQAHIDSRLRPSLKLYFYLSEVGKNNGAFSIYKGTSNWHKYSKLAITMKFFRQNYFSNQFCKSFQKNYRLLTGSFGESFVFSGNALHSATNVVEDKRDTLQIYFEFPDLRWYSLLKK